jgi:hypothetical protein
MSTKLQGKKRFTYETGSVAFECAVVDLHSASINIGTININSTALGVACPPTGIGTKM